MGNKVKPKKADEIIKKNIFNSIEWQEHITVLDLSNRDISKFNSNLQLPLRLETLDLSNNKLEEVPSIVLKLENLKTLNLSFNSIQFFDDTPNFCHAIETLKLNDNKLEGPPYWIWINSPKNLRHLDLSKNRDLCLSFADYNLEELLQYSNSVTRIDIHNCRLGQHLQLLSVFKHAKELNLGYDSCNFDSVNNVINIPCPALEKCLDIEKLNLCNTHIYSIQQNIDIYKYLIEINLSQNNINSLPNEFCNLESLELCILSFNKILYLPDDMYKLIKLTALYLDNNELCMLPETIDKLENLKILDLYNNHLYEGFKDINRLEQYDFAQNYEDEPEETEYLEKKEKLRLRFSARLDRRAPEQIHEETDGSVHSIDEEVYSIQEPEVSPISRCSSPEDWDSDDYWIPSQADLFTKPRYTHSNPIPSHTIHWVNFVKKKMAEGNFCPIDMHLAVAITDQVKYEKLCNPQPEYESDGQFDDYSEDDS